MFADPDARDPFMRSATFGFRCAKYIGPAAPALLSGFTATGRDYTREKPVSEEIYRAYRNLYAYDRTELNPVIEAKDDSAPYWRREKIRLNAAYGGELLPVYLFLPRNAKPPYQTVVYFPGAGDFLERRPSDRLSPSESRTRTDFLLRSGRAVVYPIYFGTYERKPQGAVVRPAATSVAFRDMIVACHKDLARTLDYLETRPDIDKPRLAYYGLSLGAMLGPVFTAVDPRFRAAVFLVGGLAIEPFAPEVDPLNFAPRSRVPVLMLNGRYDFSFTLEGSQLPLLRLLGAADKDKRHVLYDTGHDVPAAPMIKEALEWLDRYLGPVETAR
jgi:dienelactone hydrolase